MCLNCHYLQILWVCALRSKQAELRSFSFEELVLFENLKVLLGFIVFHIKEKLVSPVIKKLECSGLLTCQPKGFFSCTEVE